MTVEKAFVVAPNWFGYDAIIARFNLDPGDCYQCDTLWEAVRMVFHNELQGIPAGVYTANGRIGRRVEREGQEAA